MNHIGIKTDNKQIAAIKLNACNIRFFFYQLATASDIIQYRITQCRSIQTTTILLILCSNTGRTGMRIGYRDAFFQVFHTNCDLRELQKSTLWKLDQQTNNELHQHQNLHLFLEVISCSRSVPSRRIDF